MTALFSRERTGEGQFIDISMMDGALALNCLRWGKFIADGKVPSPGDDFLNHGYACYNIYETGDGRYMSLGALEPQFWEAFCLAVDHPEWNLPTYFEPGPHQKVLQQDIANLFRQKTQEEWSGFFAARDCCCEPVLHLAEVMDDDAVRARKMVVEMVHESWGAYRQLGIAPKFSRTPGEIRTHAPELGEHTQSILKQAGYVLSEIEAFRAKGAV
jgi:crotonobetainyl-CoA:carnitine CoA-transferase CaiB-like acyl-CoA transferase